MEEFSFVWVLYTISQGSYFLPVLDTHIFKEEKLFCEYTLQNNLLTRHTNFDSVSISTFISNILTKLSIKNKLRRLSEKIACIVTKSSKNFITYKELKELSINHVFLSKIISFQLAKPNYYREMKRLVFKLVCNNGMYESSFYEKTENSLVLCGERNYYEKAKDVVSLVMMYVQTLKSKKIMSLTVELVSDDDFFLWIFDMPECFVIDSVEVPTGLESFEECDSPVKKNSEGGLKSTIVKFVNTANPILIYKPSDDHSLHIEDPPDVQSTRRNSTFKKDAKKKRVSSEDTEKFQDFLEILSKTYAKFSAESTGKKVRQEDVENEYKRISRMLSPEPENTRKFSQVFFSVSPQPSSPLYKTPHKSSFVISSQTSRKASEVQVSKPATYRIRVLKTVKDSKN